MKENMGITDRLVRTLAAVTIVVLYSTNTISGALGIGLMVLAGVLLLTSLVSFCPFYLLFGISTKGDTADEYYD